MKPHNLLSVYILFLINTASFSQSLFPIISLNNTNTRAASTSITCTELSRYQDIRFCKIDDSTSLSKEFLKTLRFNRSTQWPITIVELSEKILEAGANPGLGIRKVHLEGYIGSGVSLAIIDQNLSGDHPEFAGKIIKYVDLGCEQDPRSGSMHGPAVTSLLIGTNMGTAPGARVYYYAVPSWKKDSEYYAKALMLIIDENTRLPRDQKIRAVSVSAAPSGSGSPFTKNSGSWDDAVRKASDAGILVLDCTSDRGIVGPGYYDPQNPDKLEGFSAGWPNETSPFITDSKKIFAPTSFRTLAEEYVQGEPSYQYTSVGGLSWAIPYVCGVAALLWQINPSITNTEMETILIKTAYHTTRGVPVIDASSAINFVLTNTSPRPNAH